MAIQATIVLIACLLQLALALPQSPFLNTRASSGCGKKSFLPGVTQYRFGLKSSGKDRSYSYHVPSSYDPNKVYPVVLGFHGSSSIGAFFELDTKMSEARYSGDKIMVYPNGVGGSWAGPTYHKDSSVQEDVQFVADVIADAKQKFCVDEQRVYGVGMSNGGGFIGTLACDAVGSTLFRAVAAASGAFYTDVNGPANGCAPSKVVPMLEIHGAADKTVKYEGGQGDGGPEPAISDWLEWWAQRNACSSKTEEMLDDGKVHHYSWTCGGVTGLLQHYKVDDLGHCWADTELNISQLTVPQGPSVIKASEIVMKFFDTVAA
ncbi:carbohydrate esterase family 1 protein [Cucurbitaria berberidis CBS 394.84]|uniref:feruloyl esterase n=1 Tax=Cucurbitaria berberidis CBS 394.84 TaxID=1168544 RepID=A0A9P4LDN0_9PLEO|nr:carbohydrate esterase family 1 protein [Cucurbitaria berberidis CBS 394.84]KAF1850264.1 carbohydrate esterase family 1 protein [Cucurbitaria berberidis CBS 394.84]